MVLLTDSCLALGVFNVYSQPGVFQM